MKISRKVAAGLVTVVSLCAHTEGSAQESTKQYGMPEAKYEVRLEKSVMIPMRDGIRLSTDLYFPVNANEKLPVILQRNPYNKKKDRERTPTQESY